MGPLLCSEVYFLSSRMVRGGGRRTDGSGLIGSELQVLGKYIGEYSYYILSTGLVDCEGLPSYSIYLINQPVNRETRSTIQLDSVTTFWPGGALFLGSAPPVGSI